MHIAKRLPPSAPAHRAESEAAAWMMIVVLLGLMCFALASLLARVAG
jgi:hypothetical protein